MERTALRRPLGSPTPASSTVSDSSQSRWDLTPTGKKSRRGNDRPSYPDGSDPWSLVTGAEPFPRAFRPTPKVKQSAVTRASRESTPARSQIFPYAPPCHAALLPATRSVVISLLHLCTRQSRICTFALNALINRASGPPGLSCAPLVNVSTCQHAPSRKRCLACLQNAIQFRLIHPQTAFRELSGQAVHSFECTQIRPFRSLLGALAKRCGLTPGSADL